MYNQNINSNGMCHCDNGSKNRLIITCVKTSDRSRKMVNRDYTVYPAENSFKRNLYKPHTQYYMNSVYRQDKNKNIHKISML